MGEGVFWAENELGIGRFLGPESWIGRDGPGAFWRRRRRAYVYFIHFGGQSVGQIYGPKMCLLWKMNWVH
jgi:hypothetical protein